MSTISMAVDEYIELEKTTRLKAKDIFNKIILLGITGIMALLFLPYLFPVFDDLFLPNPIINIDTEIRELQNSLDIDLDDYPVNVWEKIDIESNKGLKNFHFTTEKIGFIIGNNGMLLRTQNGGDSWEKIDIGNKSGLVDIYFTTEKIGFILGEYGMLLRTQNGGSSWKEIDIGVTTTLYKFHFTTEKIGFIIGNNGMLLRTQNGGGSWEKIDVGGTTGLDDIYFTTEKIGFIIRGTKISSLGWLKTESTLLRTQNGGDSWEKIDIGVTTELYKFHFTTEKIGFIIGGWTAYESTLLRTQNGGDSWEKIDIGNKSGLADIYFTTEKIGFILGNYGMLIRTKNGGGSWENIDVGSNKGLKTFHFNTEKIGFIIGKNGMLLRTQNGGGSWEKIDVGSTTELEDIHFTTEKIGFIIGKNGILKREVDTTETIDKISALVKQVGFDKSMDNLETLENIKVHLNKMPDYLSNLNNRISTNAILLSKSREVFKVNMDLDNTLLKKSIQTMGRVSILALLVYFIQILLNNHRYYERLADFYLSRANLFTLMSDDIFKQLATVDLIELTYPALEYGQQAQFNTPNLFKETIKPN